MYGIVTCDIYVTKLFVSVREEENNDVIMYDNDRHLGSWGNCQYL